jgi:cytochrome c-type biogenesis protein CcmE
MGGPGKTWALGFEDPMSRLDEELAQAVDDTEAGSPAREPASERPVVQATPTDSPRSRRHLGLLIALLVMGGGILALVFTSFEGAAIYSKGVDELMAERTKLASRNVRVEGTLVKGSLVRRDQPCEYRFRIAKNGSEVEVRYPQCVVPDTFRDVPGMDVAVTAEGKLASEGHFQAATIFAKCPSKYEMKDRAAKGEQAPHELVPAGVSNNGS